MADSLAVANTPNKRVYRRFVEEVINGGDISIIPDLFDEHYVDHTAPPGAPHEGTVFDQIAMIPKMFRGAFPDVHFTIEELVEEGDWVATRVTGRAQHLGRPFMGVPPSGRHVAWSSLGFFRVSNGKIVEHYGQPDLLGLREQISAKPEPGSIDENRAIITRYVYEVNMQNYDAFDEFVDPAFVDHDPIPGQQPGIPGLKDAYRMFSAAFPDVWFTFEDLIAEGDLVVGRGVISGTHKGDFLGMPPTGKTVNWTGTRLFRVKNGKVTEGWINIDMLGLIGQIREPAGAAAQGGGNVN
jgi:predicted ester cyclase